MGVYQLNVNVGLMQDIIENSLGLLELVMVLNAANVAKQFLKWQQNLDSQPQQRRQLPPQRQSRMIVLVGIPSGIFVAILMYMMSLEVWVAGIVEHTVESVAWESIQTAPNQRQLLYLTQLDRKRFVNAEVPFMMKLALTPMLIRLAVIPAASRIVDLPSLCQQHR